MWGRGLKERIIATESDFEKLTIEGSGTKTKAWKLCEKNKEIRYSWNL
jgi:hypothetical protein